MSIKAIGQSMKQFNAVEAPSGLAGKVIEDAVIGKAVEGVGEALGVSDFFKDATENVIKGARTLASPFKKNTDSEDHAKTIETGVKNIQDNEKS